MADSDAKADLHRYLQSAREALLWKLDGLSEYDLAGLRDGMSNLPDVDGAWWEGYRTRLQDVARSFAAAD